MGSDLLRAGLQMLAQRACSVMLGNEVIAMTKRQMIEPFDLDLELKEIRDDADEHWTMRALARLSVGVEPPKALSEVDRLIDALRTTDGTSQAITSIFCGSKDAYARRLFAVIDGRDPFGRLAYIHRLKSLLEARLLIEHAMTDDGISVTASPSAYSDLKERPVDNF
jgi:hypothetical protein